MKELTVMDLAKACAFQIEKGNGNKVVLISNDDEGNGFHTLFYEFTDEKEDIKACLEFEHDHHSVDDVVILG